MVMYSEEVDRMVRDEVAGASAAAGATTTASIATKDALVAPSTPRKRRHESGDAGAVVGVVRRVWPMEDGEHGEMVSLECPCGGSARWFESYGNAGAPCDRCERSVVPPAGAVEVGRAVRSEVERQVREEFEIPQGRTPEDTLSVTPTRQTTGYCGPAALLCLLQFFGVSTTEDEVAKQGGATHTDGIGTEGIVRAAKALGMKTAEYHENGSSADIERLVKQEKIPVLVFWYGHGRRGDGGHASLVVGSDERNVYMMDPEPGMVVAKLWEKFLGSWFSFDNAEPSKDNLHVGEYFVIRPW